MRLGGLLPAHCIEPAEEQAWRRRESKDAGRLARQLVLRAAKFSVFGAEGRSGRMTGSSSRGDDVGSVRVTHGPEDRGAGPRIDVRSALDDDPQELDVTDVARDALAASLFALDRSKEQSDGAFVLFDPGRPALRPRTRTCRGARTRHDSRRWRPDTIHVAALRKALGRCGSCQRRDDRDAHRDRS